MGRAWGEGGWGEGGASVGECWGGLGGLGSLGVAPSARLHLGPGYEEKRPLTHQHLLRLEVEPMDSMLVGGVHGGNHLAGTWMYIISTPSGPKFLVTNCASMVLNFGVGATSSASVRAPSLLSCPLSPPLLPPPARSYMPSLAHPSAPTHPTTHPSSGRFTTRATTPRPHSPATASRFSFRRLSRRPRWT